MPKLELSIAAGDYDRVRPLIDGTVPIDGVAPVFMTLEPEEIFFRAFRHAEFDIAELSLSSFTVRTARGRQPLCRRARVPLTRLPALRHLRPHRPRHPDARRSQGPQGRPRRIPAHRQCVDTRLPRRRLPSRAGVDPMGAGRHRGAGSAREDPDHAAAGRESDGGAGRALAVGAAARRRDRRPDRPAHAFGDDGRQSADRLAVPRSAQRGDRELPPDGELSRSCI